VVFGMLEQVVEAIGRVHGRLGKHLISQYLCGSNNAKVHKLNLHRLSGFGILEGLRQTDGVVLVDALLSAGALRQQEVNRHRPTVSVAPEMMNSATRRQVLGHIQLPRPLRSKLASSKIGRAVAQESSSDSSPTGKAASERSASEKTPPDRPIEDEVAAARAESSHAASPAETAQASHQSAAEQVSGVRKPDAAPADVRVMVDGGDLPDWTWTVMLFAKDFDWREIMKIRRMRDEELAASLCLALRQGQRLDRRWVAPDDGAVRTPGQQRVWREMRRRSSAGVG
jgi:hypothetical protein